MKHTNHSTMMCTGHVTSYIITISDQIIRSENLPIVPFQETYSGALLPGQLWLKKELSI